MRDIKKGDIVKLKMELLGNPVGTLGAVYEEYDLGTGLVGVSVIFENGEYDGFSKDDQMRMLDRVSHDETIAVYDFRNVRQLTKDYEAGMFNCIQ